MKGFYENWKDEWYAAGDLLDKLGKENLTKEYESKYGPITLDSDSLNSYPWSWNDMPWPWDNQEDYMFKYIKKLEYPIKIKKKNF